jgi:hypothetical protein
MFSINTIKKIYILYGYNLGYGLSRVINTSKFVFEHATMAGQLFDSMIVPLVLPIVILYLTYLNLP